MSATRKAPVKTPAPLLGQAKPARAGLLRKVVSVYGHYAEMKCSDCGALGCLIPVPHKVKAAA